MNNGTNYSLDNASVFKKQTEMVKRLAKPGQAILDSLTPSKCHLWHMASCIPGEAGELFDAVKKHVIYTKELDVDNVKEEIGDLVFYMLGICNELNIDFFECLTLNQAKLADKDKGRYANGYTDQAAIERADKVGE